MQCTNRPSAGTRNCVAEGQTATKPEQSTIKGTVAVIAKAHINRPVIDKGFCKKWLRKYLEELDPAKLYFIRADIAEFSEYERRLPGLAKSGDTELLDLVSNRYKARAESALAHAIQRIHEPFDFSIAEQMPIYHSDWVVSEEDRTNRWRMQLKYDLLIEKLNTSEKEDRLAFLTARYESIREQVNQRTQQQETGVYLNSFCLTADPHSGYITQKEFNSYRSTKSRAYSIGIQIRRNRGRAIIQNVGPTFKQVPNSQRLVGCELMAIRSKNGLIHNLREISPETINRLTKSGLGKDEMITLEVYDETKMDRFAVAWPRLNVTKQK